MVKNTERVVAYIGLGSNMGDREDNLRSAIRLLGEADGVTVTRISGFHETEPVGYTEQARFINAAVEVETTLTPYELLLLCMGIESGLGRVREFRWGPRTVDLDILLYGNEVISTDELKVPHSLMHVREFVLVPLNEIAPDVVHPVLKRTIRELLEALTN